MKSKIKLPTWAITIVCAFLCITPNSVYSLPDKCSIVIHMPQEAEGDKIVLRIKNHYLAPERGARVYDRYIAPEEHIGFVQNGVLRMEFEIAGDLQYVSLISKKLDTTRFTLQERIKDPGLKQFKEKNHILAWNGYMEAGDALEAHWDDGNLVFNDPKDGKWRFQMDLERRPLTDPNFPKRSTLAITPEDINTIRATIKHYGDEATYKLVLLEQYRSQMSALAYEVLYADIVGESLTSKYRTGIAYFYLNLNQESKDQELAVVDYFGKTLYQQDAALPNFISEKAKGYSTAYAGGVFSVLWANADYERKKGAEVPPESILETILENYKGLLQEKLLYRYAMTRVHVSGLDPQVAISEWNTVHQHLQLSPYKATVQKFIDLSTPNAAVVDFTCLDATGRAWSLRDFRGKTVFVDAWFSGCGACVDVSKGMQNVEKAFRGDSSIIFVSLSIDSDRETWLQSISSDAKPNSQYPFAGQHYSGEESIYLYAAGKKENSAFMETYGPGYPVLLLIDKNGRLISSTPPRPSENREKNDIFIQYLRSQLEKQK